MARYKQILNLGDVVIPAATPAVDAVVQTTVLPGGILQVSFPGFTPDGALPVNAHAFYTPSLTPDGNTFDELIASGVPYVKTPVSGPDVLPLAPTGIAAGKYALKLFLEYTA